MRWTEGYATMINANDDSRNTDALSEREMSDQGDGSRSAKSAGKPKKRKYSRTLRDVQTLETGVSKALHRLVRSTEVGIRTWRKSMKKSALKKRDGAVRDAIENYAKALSRQVGIASRAPLDIVRSLPKLGNRKALTRTFLGFFR
jgi:hypothetical protein